MHKKDVLPCGCRCSYDEDEYGDFTHLRVTWLCDDHTKNWMVWISSHPANQLPSTDRK